MDTWILTLEVPGTYWEGAELKVKVSFGQGYPMSCPEIMFLTKVFHPGINLETGTICDA